MRHRPSGDRNLQTKGSAPVDNSTQEITIVSAFTLNGAGGNEAAVVRNADDLSERQMQSIAAETGLSEAVFLSRSSKATYKVDFFTPRRRIAHCGHATIAAFGLLETIGELSPGNYSKETIDGLREIVIDHGYTGMQQLAPRFEDIDQNAVLNALGVAETDVDPRFAPVLVNTGNSFILVGLKSASRLAALTPDFATLEALSERYDLVGFYPFALGTKPTFDASARMFAPRYGIAEESATGMAAGPLASLLFKAGSVGSQVRVGQGQFMPQPSPSAIEVRLNIRDGAIIDLQAGGSVLIINKRVLGPVAT
jgi:PhzF family phenazine biosynthesis protein